MGAGVAPALLDVIRQVPIMSKARLNEPGSISLILPELPERMCA